MTHRQFEYPALYQTASDLSAGSQSTFLWLIRTEYLLLLLAAVFSMDLSKKPAFYGVYACVFIFSLGTLIARSWLKPEQDWYRGRALAESIKTSCWRYCMRAEPFGDHADVAVPRAEFRNHLLAILRANRHIGDKMPPDSAARDQVTQSMEATRALPLDDRKAFYEQHRIVEQRAWYARKAGANRKASRRWVAAAIGTYVVAVALVIFRIAFPQRELWPIEPLIVAASSIIGWTQVKRFNELASSYTLTAHEIGIVKGELDEVDTDEKLSVFINDAEQAFSREHTQWVARQQTS